MDDKPKLDPSEAERFRIEDSSVPVAPANAFPKTTSARRKWLFELTGFAADHELDEHEWYLLNYSLNKGLKLEVDPRTLKMLSLMDYALAGASRWVNTPYMNVLRGDSTAAHSKQVMNDVQHVFDQAFGMGRTPPEMQQMRRDALVGAWVHDMGEAVFELTTATDMFRLEDYPDEKKAVKDAKDVFEEELMHFGCELALKQMDGGKEGDFIKEMRAIREIFLKGDPSLPLMDKGKFSHYTTAARRVMEKIEAARGEMARISKQYHLPTTPSPEVENIIKIYHLAEEPGSFINPVVKTVESVEGQRYLQKNSYLNEAQRNLIRASEAQYRPRNVNYDLVSDHDLVSAYDRCERRLPELYKQAAIAPAGVADPDKHILLQRKLADAVTAFTYRSLARGLSPLPHDRVGECPTYIDRSPPTNKQIEASYRSQHHLSQDDPLPVEAFIQIRATASKYNESRLAAKGDLDGQFQHKDTLGSIYRAAEHLAEEHKINADFFREHFPEGRQSLIRWDSQYKIPAPVAQRVAQEAALKKVGGPPKSTSGPELTA